MSDFKNSRWRI